MNIYKYLFYISFIGLSGFLYYTLFAMNVFSPLYEGTVILLSFVIIIVLLVFLDMAFTPLSRNKEENKDDEEIKKGETHEWHRKNEISLLCYYNIDGVLCFCVYSCWRRHVPTLLNFCYPVFIYFCFLLFQNKDKKLLHYRQRFYKKI